MNTPLEFILKFSIALAAQYLFYHLLLRKLTFYTWIRLFFLAALMFSFLLPFVSIDILLSNAARNHNKLLVDMPTISNINFLQSQHDNGSSYPPIIVGIVVAGTLILLCRLIIQLVSLLKIKNDSTFIGRDNGISIYELTRNVSSFSFGKMIFIACREDAPDLRDHIIAHEKIHAIQLHSMDILLIELVCAVNWFNPFAWLMRRAMRQNLEFIADAKALDDGFDRKEYQYSILSSASEALFPLTNSFGMPTLKKRIAMINSTPSSRSQVLKFFSLLPLLVFLSVIFRQGVLGQDNDSMASGSSGSGIFIKGSFKEGKPLVIVDELVQPASYDLNLLKPTDIRSIDVWKGKKAMDKFGKSASEGALVIRTILPVYVLNGKVQIKTSYLDRLVNTSDIEMMDVLKGKTATAKYGAAGTNGIVEISTKNK